MSPRRVWAMARKEAIHIRRDPRSLIMGILIPVILLLLFGYALTLDVDRAPLAVWDQSNTPDSREFVSRFTGAKYFQLRLAASSYRDAEKAVDSGQVLAILAVPPDFARRLADGKALAQFIVDGSDSSTAAIVLGYANQIADGFLRENYTAQLRARLGAVPPQPLELLPRVWFNADLQSRNYIIPSLIAVIMMIVAALLTSLTVAREWDGGTMEQLISTPVRPAELLWGKWLPYFAIGMLDLALAVAMGEYLFHVPRRGGLPLLFGISALFLSGALFLGLWISVAAKTQLVANQMAMIITFLPAFLLSGFVYPIHNMPPVIRLLTGLIPARYFIDALKGIYLKGVGLDVLLGDVLFLLAFAVGMAALANAKCRNKLE